MFRNEIIDMVLGGVGVVYFVILLHYTHVTMQFCWFMGVAKQHGITKNAQGLQAGNCHILIRHTLIDKNPSKNLCQTLTQGSP